MCQLDPSAGRVSLKSPVAKVLMNATVGDEVTLRTPTEVERIEVLEIRYDPLL